ncbi:MAG: hypothetical protein Tsb0020_47160 [Haliangiales bacterium]
MIDAARRGALFGGDGARPEDGDEHGRGSQPEYPTTPPAACSAAAADRPPVSEFYKNFSVTFLSALPTNYSRH